MLRDAGERSNSERKRLARGPFEAALISCGRLHDHPEAPELLRSQFLKETFPYAVETYLDGLLLPGRERELRFPEHDIAEP